MIDPFQTLFAVPLECDSCVQDVSSSLKKLPARHCRGNRYSPTSFILFSSALRIPRRRSIYLHLHRLLRRWFRRFKIQAVTRFFGVVGSQTVFVLPHPGKKFKVWLVDTELGYETGAAVAILETHAKDIPNPVRGLVRIVQVSSKLTILDLTIQGLSPGRYHATIRASGDISRGAASTGDVWERQKSEKEEADAPPRGEFGPIDVGKSGAASVLLDKPIEVWEIIGRSFVVSKERDGSFKPDGPDTVVGVIARSAGVWENEKTVCSCSGKTIWDERKEGIERGMV